jgi:hypothetical protein
MTFTSCHVMSVYDYHVCTYVCICNVFVINILYDNFIKVRRVESQSQHSMGHYFPRKTGFCMLKN